MKQVVLIGDSIRMGYQETVREQLREVAEVWSPTENGAHTTNLLVHLHPWIIARQPDVLHINAGLHDLKTLAYDTREQIVPPEIYRRNVAAILDTVRRLSPQTQILWALTTPVLEDRVRAIREQHRDFLRYAADVDTYNTVAQDVCAERDIPVNDLYAVVQTLGPETALTADGVHFTGDAYKSLGEAVAGAIRSWL